jgi:hypothetical protein
MKTIVLGSVLSVAAIMQSISRLEEMKSVPPKPVPVIHKQIIAKKIVHHRSQIAKSPRAAHKKKIYDLAKAHNV